MINIAAISKILGGQTIYEDASFQINDGEKIGLVGANGTGKTTFFKMITGEERPDKGQISIQSGIKIGYFSQNVDEMAGKSALDEAVSGNTRVNELGIKLKQFEERLIDQEISPKEMDQILEEMGEVQTEFEKLGGYELETVGAEILTGLGIKPSEHQKPVQDFSGGQKMRIALAKVLILMPDLILMDEPTNYLDMETILWLEKWLINFKGAILLTSHDREFINRVVNKIVEVARGTTTSYTGNYEFYLSEKETRKKQNKSEFDRQRSMLKKEEEFIARFQARASHAAQVQSRVKKIDKIERIDLIEEEDEMSILLPHIPRGGNDVVIINDLGKTWKNNTGEPNEVFANLSTHINRQEKIGIVGINGAGKSTLLNIISGNTEQTTGEVKIGPSIKLGYFGQNSYETLNPENTVLDELLGKLPTASDGLVRNILAAFLFKGDEVFKKIKYLSGGEKARIILAWLLSTPFNFLILDEPTNHLDISSREVLLDALKRYEGTIMIVSHDRHFLHQLIDRVLEVDKGTILSFKGSYSEYLSNH